MGNGELTPSFALPALTAFALPINLSLAQNACFLGFSLPVLFSIPLGRWKEVMKGVCGASLTAGVKPQHQRGLGGQSGKIQAIGSIQCFTGKST